MMNFRSLFAIGGLIASSGASAELVECKPAPEVYFLQDGSGSVWAIAQHLSSEIGILIDNLTKQYSRFRFGFSTWTDKALPFRGFGNRYAVPSLDYPFVYGIGLSDDATAVQKVISKAQSMHGGDFPEDPYEAILNAALDPRSGWTSTEIGDFGDGTSPVRIIALITDDVPHYEGDAQSGILRFNAPRYPKDISFPGGYGHESMFYVDSGVFMAGANNATSENYKRFIQLWYNQDEGLLNEAETAELNALHNTFGPAPWKSVAPHPGTYLEKEDFAKYDFPSLDQVGQALRDKDIKVAMMIMEPKDVGLGTYDLCVSRGLNADTPADVVECAKAVYAADLAQMGVDAVIASIKSVDEFDSLLKNMVSEISKGTCPLPDPTLPPEPSTDAAPSTEPGLPSDAAPSTEAAIPTDGAPSTGGPLPTDAAPSTEAAIPTDAASSGAVLPTDAAPSTEAAQASDAASSGAEGSTNGGPSTEAGAASGAAGSTTDGTDTTGVPPIPVPVPEDGGNSTAKIAGAAGGALAGVGALGAAAWKRFGMGGFSKGGVSPDVVGENVEVADAPMERETMEEIRMDMFQ